MKNYTSVIKVEWCGNNHEAENEIDYKRKVIEQFYDEFGIELNPEEITQIEEV